MVLKKTEKFFKYNFAKFLIFRKIVEKIVGKFLTNFQVKFSINYFRRKINKYLFTIYRNFKDDYQLNLKNNLENF